MSRNGAGRAGERGFPEVAKQEGEGVPKRQGHQSGSSECEWGRKWGPGGDRQAGPGQHTHKSLVTVIRCPHTSHPTREPHFPAQSHTGQKTPRSWDLLVTVIRGVVEASSRLFQLSHIHTPGLWTDTPCQFCPLLKNSWDLWPARYDPEALVWHSRLLAPGPSCTLPFFLQGGWVPPRTGP